MKIEEIYVACYKGDLHLTQICIASIRYWYPKIPIFLIKDTLKGDFKTKHIETHFDVTVFKSKLQKFGWGVSKIEPLLINERKRVLILDSDIVFVGKILEKLEQYHEDFIVSGENIINPYSDWVKKTYYDFAKVKEMNPEFSTSFVFNTGQFVATTGLIKRQELSSFIDYNFTPPKLLKSSILSCADQGILNYFLINKYNNKEISSKDETILIWPCRNGADFINLDNIRQKNGYPYVIHCAGCVRPIISEIKRYDIIQFFENEFYNKISNGAVLHNIIKLKRLAYMLGKKIKDKVKN